MYVWYFCCLVNGACIGNQEAILSFLTDVTYIRRVLHIYSSVPSGLGAFFWEHFMSMDI